MIFDRYLDDLKNKNFSSVIFSQFLEDISETYLESHSHAEIVRDFIAGMTDHYFLQLCPENMRPAYRIM
jgi:dGTPase